MSLPYPALTFTPFDVLAAADLNKMTANDDALAAGTGLNNSVVVTAKIANSNITADKLATGATTARVATAESTSSATFTDLATTTDSVTVTIGVNGLAYCTIYCYTITPSGSSAYGLVSPAVSGATTIAAADSGANQFALKQQGTVDSSRSTSFLYTGLTPGSTTFKLKYRSSTGSCNFIERKITVIPL